MKTTAIPSADSGVRRKISEATARILLFDLSVRGHHPSYIFHLIRYWRTHQLLGQLDIVVSPRFLQEHSEVIDWVKRHQLKNVQFTAISASEAAELNSRKSRLQRSLRNYKEWMLLCRYAERLRSTHCLLMFFDTSALPLAFARSAPCLVSGIYFQPTFHYHLWTSGRRSLKSRLQAWRERWLLERILSRPQVETLFCLDPFAVDRLHQLNKTHQVVSLADPVEIADDASDRAWVLHQQLDIDRNRKVFLLFGSLTERKGISPLLAAIEQLSDRECQRVCLLLVGESNIEAQIQPRIERICKERPIQIVTHYEFVADGDVPAYFELSDIVLAPYQQHVGMSGILLLAAAAQTPVLSADYGLMGKMVRCYQLGLTVDSTAPEQIAVGLRRCLKAIENGDMSELADLSMMRTFANQNSVEQFAKTIFQRLMPQ